MIGAMPKMNILTACFLLLITYGNAFKIRARNDQKRAGDSDGVLVKCPPWHPFQCPNGDCVPIKYLCDGSPDCGDGYDENKSMCTAATRPPVEETASFLNALLNAHGSDFFVLVFGEKGKNSLKEMGGVNKVAVAFSQSPTIQAFAAEMNMSDEEVEKMQEVMTSIASGSIANFSSSEAANFRFFVQKLQETGFFF